MLKLTTSIALPHGLVDEFQDTNENQWATIHALTNPNDPHDDTPAPLFVVGDPKQSIYGFRGGDVRVFEAVRSQLNAVADAEIPLVTSFRTHGPLVTAFNYIFGHILRQEPGSLVAEYEIDYGVPMNAHRADPPTDAPPVEIILLDRNPRDPVSGELLIDEDGKTIKLKMAEVRPWEADVLAARLRELVDGGREIYDRDLECTRPLQYGDIALLFRTLNIATPYEDALRAAGISYVTVGGRGYYDRQEVWDMLSLLEALNNPYDELALATVLRSPLFSLSDEALLAMRVRRPSKRELENKGDPNLKRLPLWEELRYAADNTHPFIPVDERERTSAAYQTLLELYNLAGRVTIYELLRAALERTGYLATLTALPEARRRRANVRKLVNQALDSGKVTLSAFIAYVRDLQDREVREREADTELSDAVTLMTVHQSKGLEFPVVVLPDTNRGGGSRSGTVIVDEDLGVLCRVVDDSGERQQPALYDQVVAVQNAKDTVESKRLLYVAATRAQ
ncbi:MAG: 3'-5' exonuclease, partial [Chloroflexota bacterium]